MPASTSHLRAIEWAVISTDKDTGVETVKGYVQRDESVGWLAIGLNGARIASTDTRHRAHLAVVGRGDKPKYREPRVAK